MKGNTIISGLLVLLILPLVSCGGGGGGGNSDPGNTGVDITGLSVTITPPIVVPTAANDPATINFTATKNIAGNAYPVQVDQCVVSYAYTGVAPAPAVPIPNLTIPTPCSILADGAGECVMTLITSAMKADWWNNGTDRGWSLPGTYPAPYTATFNCDFSNLNANNGAFGTNVAFSLELASNQMTVLPATANTGTNTGSSTFTITWGMPAFLITSDVAFVDLSLVDATNNSFTVTGNGTGSGDATITVTDFLGQTVEVVVTVPAP